MTGVVISALEQAPAAPMGGISGNNPQVRGVLFSPIGSATRDNIGLQNGPSGSVYHDTSVFPTYAPQINQGAVPPTSNFGSQPFPVRLWNKAKDYGSNLVVYAMSGKPPQ
jgi:hypothetical protein